jgi:group I intron endonuclease
MKNTLIHYVYLTTNLVNGKQYIGDHTIKNDKKYYIGSGILLLYAIKKYGECNFFKEILEWFPTRQEAFNAQVKYINEFNTLIPNGYNISPKGGHLAKESLSDETKKKISDAKMGKKRKPFSKDHIKNIGKSSIGRNKGRKFNSSPKKGKPLCDETKKKISDAQKGKIPWISGKHHSNETKEKISKNSKGKNKGKIPWNKGLKFKNI